MYRDIIHYRLAADVKEEQLLRVAQRIIKDWMTKQNGFISWTIHKNSDGTYNDIVTWKDQASAQAAEIDMVNIPDAGEWMGCYEPGSISTQKASEIMAFTNT